MKEAARVLTALQHPHIPAVYDIGTFCELTYIACEYAPGSLAKEIANGYMSERIEWFIDTIASVA